MSDNNRTKVAALVVSLAIHGAVGWLMPGESEPREQKRSPERRIVARTLPKPSKPKQLPKPKPAPQKQPEIKTPDLPKPPVEKAQPTEETKETEKPAAKVPEPVTPKKAKRAPKRRSGRNLTSKRKRPGAKAIDPGSKRGGPKNIGDWDPSGPAGPGPIDPNGGNEDGTRVERPSPTPKPKAPSAGGSDTSKTRPKKRKPKLRPAVPVYRPTPRWPAGLIKSGPITVPVRVRIDASGKLTSAKAMGSAPKLAKRAAVAFVKTIRWRPGRQGDKNVKSTIVYTVKFRP